MTKPTFSIVLIAKNEANTLPKLFTSLEEFKNRGGEVCLLDTGSTDSTVKIATDWGCKVTEVGKKFLKTVSPSLAKKINARFVGRSEQFIIDGGDQLFDFASARNYVSSLASNDMICTLDADEAYSVFDIDKINSLIEAGWEKFEYQFVFAHDAQGRAAIQFVQSKFFDRRKSKWEGIVHEVLVGEAKTCYVDPSVILLEHWQEQGKEHRGNYLIGLAIDCFNNQTKDRQSHYLARELMYTNHPKSAIKEFERHLTMNGWATERAQSMIYMGDCYGKLGNLEKQIYWYQQSFNLDPTRRAALMSLALLMKAQNNPHAASAYAGAALQLPWVDYYANERAYYEHLPHEVLYWAKGWMGDIPSAQEHLLKALSYNPYNPEYLRDTKYYFEYPDQDIKGWMTFPELQFLYNTAKKFNGKKIVEIGSWKGRSSHALLSGNRDGTVFCVDTWKGSEDVRDDTSWMAQREDVFKVFEWNTRQFNNLKVVRKKSVEAAADFEDGSIDMIFIDAGHDYESCRDDIRVWLPKLKPGGLFCGHDYMPSWMGVIKAVDEAFDKPDAVTDTIWQIDFQKRILYKPHILSRMKVEKKIEGTTGIDDTDLKGFDNYNSNQLIPKNIFTFWFGDEAPEGIKKCIESQKIPGYKHALITLKNYPTAIPYVNTAIAAKKWVKAVDYLKMWYLHEYGGIVMDADMEILPGKNFDKLLEENMFVAQEENGFLGYSLVGGMKGHPIAVQYLKDIPEKFKGDDDLNFESSMEYYTNLVMQQDFYGVKILGPDYFFPYNHQTGKINVTENTLSFHHFYKSWINTTDLLPTVCIIIPQLGREEGLKKCLESIDKLYYPKHLIKVAVIEGDETVPEKVKRAVEENPDAQYYCYAANDMTFEPESLYTVISQCNYIGVGLGSFNEGDLLPDNGNICTHFVISNTLLQMIGGVIFDTRLKHVGVDNLLWKKCEEIGQAFLCNGAKINHNHFSKGAPMDEVYEKGWKHIEEDRKLLAKLLP